MVDLHAHTTASDGSLTPSELVTLAGEVGLSALAVTDHDTLDGLEEAQRAAAQTGMELVPGIELAVQYHSGRFHMLGLLIDRYSPVLNNRLTELKENRARRNERMAARLRELGLPITLDDVVAESGGGQVGRPHFVAALIRKGLVRSAREAWEKYVMDGAAAHVPKDKIGLQEGIDLIHAAGGVAVMAHPMSVKLEEDQLRSELKRLKSMGLDGAECYYSQYPPERVHFLLDATAAAGLLPSGGSDFHGTPKPDVHLGVIYQGRAVPPNVLSSLKQAALSHQQRK